MKRILKEGFAVLNKDEEWYDGVTSGQILDWLERREKQASNSDAAPAEQDKESRFVEGDWVVAFDGNVGQIVNYTEHYAVVSCGDTSFMTEATSVRPWTTQDAKVGDVLVDYFGNVGIFKRNANDLWESFGYLGVVSGEFVCDGTYLHPTSSCHPATKEQRSLMFSKMREAGYLWNISEAKMEICWCPSEEQMSLLAKAAKEGDGEQRKDLMVLYNELKKFVMKK